MPHPVNGRNEESWLTKGISGVKNLGSPKGFLLNNPMFWLALEIQSVASWTHNIILVTKGKYIMDGGACGLFLNKSVCCNLCFFCGKLCKHITLITVKSITWVDDCFVHTFTTKKKLHDLAIFLYTHLPQQNKNYAT